ncbi:MAG: hypothetical protein AAF563_13600 [Pseudomonadota bacterium]
MPGLRAFLLILAGLTTTALHSPTLMAADLNFGRSLADEQCNTCHVMPGETVGLGQARDLGKVVQVVDWSHLRLREWFATAHPVRLSFQKTDRDLHELRLYLMDLQSQSMLGGLSTQ